MKTCSHPVPDDSFSGYSCCGAKAKWKAPPDAMLAGEMDVCGTHRNVIDRGLERFGKEERCTPLEENDEKA